MQLALISVLALLGGCAGGALLEAAADDDPETSVSAAGEEERTEGDGRTASTSERSTSTTEPRTSTTAPSELGTRPNPLPLGQVAELSVEGEPSWRVKVTGFQADATAAVETENEYNDPPAAGRQFAIVTLEATYIGAEEPSAVGSELTFEALDDGNVTYDVDDSCGVIPTPLDAYGDVYRGGTITGNLCWSVATEHVGSVLLVVTPYFSMDEEPFFLSLR